MSDEITLVQDVVFTLTVTDRDAALDGDTDSVHVTFKIYHNTLPVHAGDQFTCRVVSAAKRVRL